MMNRLFFSFRSGNGGVGLLSFSSLIGGKCITGTGEMVLVCFFCLAFYQRGHGLESGLALLLGMELLFFFDALSTHERFGH
jgi:hypothetical protein